MNAKEIYSQWTNANNLPDYLKDQLNDLGKDEKWIEDAFGQDINFGTAGMRGRLEPGTNRINLFTVGRVTEGLARLIDENGEEAKKRGVAISFDSRYHSREFAEHAARILGAHGIHVYLFDDLRPTPELSFAVRHLNTFAGINITASHNAKQYNGYKVYGEDGAQMAPDSDFPTVNIANPEMEDTFDLGKELADKESANLIVATDPDADRLGIVERYEDGTTRYFNGNEIGLLLLKLRHDELQSTKSNMIKSVVTSALSEKLAEHLHIDVINVLTGFKYISEQLKALENDEAKLVLAFEESHGYLLNDFSRDKDAIQTAALLIKYKEQLTQEKQTFKDVLETIYETLGYYQDKTLSPTFKGMEGKAQIKQIMEHFNNLTTIEVGELKPLFIENYIKQERTNIETGEQSKIDLPQADLIKFIFEEGFIAVRPSGTEPKMKLYFSLDVEDFTEIIESFNKMYIA